MAAFLENRGKVVGFGATVNPFSGRGVLWLASHHPRLYLALTAAAGAGGYVFLFMFPALLLVMPIALMVSVRPEMNIYQWSTVVVEALLLLIGGVMTYAISRMRFPVPSGVELSEDGFPRLFALLRELGEIYGEPRIDRVVLRDRFDIRIVKTPRTGFALSNTRTLIIGLPVLLAMSPMDAHVLLARRVGQLAGRDTGLRSWLYFLRDMWGQYLTNCGSKQSSPFRPVCIFFRWYVPRYRSISLGLARSSELDADRYALEAINDRDAARAITCQVVTDTYLTHIFWPGTIETARQSVKPNKLPHARMAKTFEEGLPEEEIRAVLEKAEKRGAGHKTTMPALADRLDNIGHRKPLLPKTLPVTAARFYLGGACDKCIEVVDRRSLKKVRSKVIKECGSDG